MSKSRKLRAAKLVWKAPKADGLTEQAGLKLWS